MAIMENNMEVLPKKVNKKTSKLSSHPTCGYVHKEKEISNVKRYLHPHIQ
jgi:hypothetical protein